MEGICRGCLDKFDSTDLIQYCERNRRLFVYSTGLQVKRNDTFTFQLCKECHLNMKISCKFKKQCRNSDKKLKNYLAIIKEDGNSVDFSTFLKDVDVTLALRFPKISSSSTPSKQRSKDNDDDDDDDNVSTCTSIQNFMSDMLEGEEMAPTEAQIIREVIQEEADILDDSLDSHWLQDDTTVDFGLDFNFGAYSTPHSINNDHCYTPKRFTDYKEVENKYVTSRKVIEVPDVAVIPTQIDMPIIDDCVIEPFESQYYFKKASESEDPSSITQAKDMPLIDYNAIEFDVGKTINVADTETEFNVKSITRDDKKMRAVKENQDNMNNSKIKKINAQKNPFVKLDIVKDNIFSIIHDLSPSGKISKSTINKECSQVKNSLSMHSKNNICSNQNTTTTIVDATIQFELEEYISKVELKKKTQLVVENKVRENEPDVIDKNLELALKNQDSHEFSLDQLLLSPKVDMRQSGASTPTIKNILFGKMTPNNNFTSFEPEFKNTEDIDESNTMDFIEDFLKHDDYKKQSTPKYSQDNAEIKIKDLINFQEFEKEKSKTDIKYKGEFEFKDVKELLRNFDKEDWISDSPAVDQSDSLNKIKDGQKSVKSNISMDEINDLDISVSNLLHIEDDQSLDLNFSICSDMFKDTQNVDNLDEDNFKRPFTPPHDKYDLEKCICKICNMSLKTPKSLRVHFTKMHKYKIPGNKSKYTRKTLLLCQYCHRTFNNKSNFNRHLRVDHEGPDRYQCEVCTLKFKNRGHFIQHRMNAHGKETKGTKADKMPKNKEKFMCIRCGRLFANLANFRVHERRHYEDYAVYCDVCDKGFYRKTDLVQHIRSHTSEYIFSCDICPNKYKRRDLLMEHVYRHLDKKDFSCDICNKKFVSNRLLKRHYKVCAIRKYEWQQNIENLKKSKSTTPVLVSNIVGSTEKIKEIMKRKGPAGVKGKSVIDKKISAAVGDKDLSPVTDEKEASEVIAAESDTDEEEIEFIAIQNINPAIKGVNKVTDGPEINAVFETE